MNHTAIQIGLWILRLGESVDEERNQESCYQKGSCEKSASKKEEVKSARASDS
jgi:hypothetical protein